MPIPTTIVAELAFVIIRLFFDCEENVVNQIKVGIIGATGMVGQRFITLLENHPYFEIAGLYASKRSAGKTYGESIKNRWKMKTPLSEKIAAMPVYDASDISLIADSVDMVFCAVNMPKDELLSYEEALAKAEIPVVSNNSANRMTKDVPMIIPEINASHTDIIAKQRKRLGTKRGFIAVKPNCSIQSYVPLIHPLMEFEPSEIFVTTYQAISGAGKNFNDWPEMLDNVIPYIGGEEEKSEKEPLKIWGKVGEEGIEHLDTLKISAQCLRVPCEDGHMAATFIRFKNKPTREQILEKWKNYKGLPQELGLPSAPEHFITYFEEADRPQTRVDRDTEKGMGICAGRLREDPIYDYKFVGLSHNTIRGAAGGAVEVAELLFRQGYFAR